MEKPPRRLHTAAIRSEGDVKFSRESLQQIRERLDIVEVVGEYTTLQRRGDRWWGLSPFKPEKTPSFAVKPEDGFYYCFSTNRGGDIFKFITEMEGISFPEAVKLLADRAGVAVDEGAPDPDEAKRRALLDVYNRVAGTFHYLLQSDPRGAEARDYAVARGISAEMIATFMLGYTLDKGEWLYQFLRKKEYTGQFLQESGLFSKRSPEYSLFRHRLMFPIVDERGRVVAFGGRALRAEERAKYINSPETIIYHKKRVLYGLHQSLDTIRTTRRAYIAEGYLDVIAIHQAGIPAAVAPLGTAFTEEQARLLKRWADSVVLVFDGDAAGIEAAVKGASTAERGKLECYIAVLPSGTDPADILKNHGAQYLRNILEQPLSAWDFILRRAQQQYPASDPRGRELLLRNVIPYIRIIDSEVRREAMLEQVADINRVSLAAVKRDYDHWRGGDTPTQGHVQTQGEKQPSDHHRTRDLTLVLVCIRTNELFAHLRNSLRHSDLKDVIAQQVFLAAEDAYRHEEAFPRSVLDRLRDEDVRNRVLEFITSGEAEGWNVAHVQDAIRRLRVEKLLIEQQEVVQQMRVLPPQSDGDLRRLQEQKMALDQEIRELKARVDDGTTK